MLDFDDHGCSSDVCGVTHLLFEFNGEVVGDLIGGGVEKFDEVGPIVEVLADNFRDEWSEFLVVRDIDGDFEQYRFSGDGDVLGFGDDVLSGWFGVEVADEEEGDDDDGGSHGGDTLAGRGKFLWLHNL